MAGDFKRWILLAQLPHKSSKTYPTERGVLVYGYKFRPQQFELKESNFLKDKAPSKKRCFLILVA